MKPVSLFDLPRAQQEALSRLGYEWKSLLQAAHIFKKEQLNTSAGSSGLESGKRADTLYVRLNESGSSLRVCFPVLDWETALLLSWLRQPEWRQRWERLLRRSHLDSLLEALPKAWKMEQKPVPNGAVIRELNITSWQEVQKLRCQCDFIILSPDGKYSVLDCTQKTEDWIHAISRILKTAPGPPALLVEVPKSGSLLEARYALKNGKIMLDSLFEVGAGD
jgi:hypothetical protein